LAEILIFSLPSLKANAGILSENSLWLLHTQYFLLKDASSFDSYYLAWHSLCSPYGVVKWAVDEQNEHHIMKILLYIFLVCRVSDFINTFALKMEAVCFSKTLISTYKATRRNSAEDQPQHCHHHENCRCTWTFIFMSSKCSPDFPCHLRASFQSFMLLWANVLIYLSPWCFLKKVYWNNSLVA
jgi:hypothetical protein